MAIPISQRGTFTEAPVIYGYSAEHTPLTVWRPGGNTVELLIFAGIHGEEPDTTVILSRALRSARSRSARCAVVMCANPDGLRLGTRGNVRGVDLNRNFPSRNWRPDPVLHKWRADSDPQVELSPGAEPGSEPEVKALLQLVKDLEPDSVVSIHSPLGLIDDPNCTALGQKLAERTGLPRTVIPNHLTPGSFGSWARDIGLAAITYELPNAPISHMLSMHLPLLQELIENGPDRG